MVRITENADKNYCNPYFVKVNSPTTVTEEDNL